MVLFPGNSKGLVGFLHTSTDLKWSWLIKITHFCLRTFPKNTIEMLWQFIYLWHTESV